MAVLGFEGTLTIDGANPGFRNLKFGFGHTEVDATTTADGGEKAYVKGLADKYVGGEFLLDDSEAAQKVLAAVQSREPVEVVAEMGGVTLSSTMYIFGSEISGSVDDAVWISVTCRPAPKSQQNAG